MSAPIAWLLGPLLLMIVGLAMVDRFLPHASIWHYLLLVLFAVLSDRRAFSGTCGDEYSATA
jgi:hypothetical protein